MAKTYWISPRSWLVNVESVAVRGSNVRVVRGIKGGVSRTAALSDESGVTTRRRMLEIFTDSGYAIVDARARIWTVNGAVRVDELAARVRDRVETYVEMYIDEVKVPELDELRPIVPPHCMYLSESVPLALLRRVLSANGLEYRIPRASFAYTYWLMQRLSSQAGSSVVAQVENRTFPSEVIAQRDRSGQGKRGVGLVLAITEFEEADAQKVVIEGDGFSPCVDGVLLT